MLDVRQQNLLFYTLVLFVVGGPLWWITTSPYRAALQPLDPTVADVEVPFELRFFYERRWLDVSELRAAVGRLMAACPDARLHAEFVDVDFHTSLEEAQQIDAFNYALDEDALNVVLLDAAQFARRFPGSASGFNATVFRPKPNARALAVRLEGDATKRQEDLVALLERLLGLQRLKSIGNEKAQKKLSVWDRLPVATLYHLQLIFLHADGRQNAEAEAEIVAQARRISALVEQKGGALVDVSVSHLWDFDAEQFVDESRPKSANKTAAQPPPVHFLPHEAVESITTEVDKYAAWLGVGIAQPLIKVAVFVDEKPIEVRDQENSPVNAIAVASWGGITTLQASGGKAAPARVTRAVLDIVKAQLNVRPVEEEWRVDFDARSPAHEFEWLRFKTQAFREHIQRATAALRSIHALRRKIEDLVVSREVAVDVYEAHEVLMATLLKARRHKQIDMKGAIRARILAERAAKHSTTLQLLNFPLEQRYAIYVPLFLPVFVHLLTSVRPHIPALRAAFFGAKTEAVAQ
ncbi:GPI transamidase component PIG-S [Aphelenchoides fujianensis]|nr:GPI transamidase component PIG-S [Aphelenchoides fujianensis]